jgi:MFS family permease
VRALPIYLLIFITGVLQSTLAPLAPLFAERLHLSTLQLGVLYAATGVAILVAALPVGFISDRLGARRVTAAAAALVALSALGQGLAANFWLLLVCRAGFGVAFGAVWTAGLTLLSGSGSKESRSSRLGSSIPVTGAASTLGPAFAGILAGKFGIAIPFVIIAVIAATTAFVLWAMPVTSFAIEQAERPSVREVVTRVRGSRALLGSVAIMVIAGLSGSVAFLLIPLQLKHDGVSVNGIGVLLGFTALVYIAASFGVSLLGDRAATLSGAGIAALVLCVALVLPVLTTATVILAVFLLIRAVCNAAMSAIAYPLASSGGEDTGIGSGSALGLINAGWAASTIVGPIGAGAVAQAAGEQWAFAVLLALTVAATGWFVLAERRSGAHPREPICRPVKSEAVR